MFSKRSASMCRVWTESSVRKDSTFFAIRNQSTSVQVARQLPNRLVNSFNDWLIWEAEPDWRESSICFIIIWVHAGQSQSFSPRGVVGSDSTERVSMCTRSWLAAEATNRLGSPCRVKITSRPPMWKQSKSQWKEKQNKIAALLLWSLAAVWLHIIQVQVSNGFKCGGFFLFFFGFRFLTFYFVVSNAFLKLSSP